MVTKLKDNLSYIKYIQKKMKERFFEWKQYEEVAQGQINDNFRISYIGNIKGYNDSQYRVSFVKDRGLLELKIYYKDEPVHFGFLLFNGIIKNIPDQDPKWRLTLCTELIDYYIDFLISFFFKI
ncbi:MAG: hypothetical protein ACK4ND_07715 [Cytophagaceae bacterium]